jgi:uncharacterized OsmC-like protein
VGDNQFTCLLERRCRMSNQQIREAVQGVIQYYTEYPDQALSEDKPATATLVGGLRFRAASSNGFELYSDMPKGIGGGATAPSAGWLLRAALANCDATMIALRAAELGITSTTLEVTVGSTSDDRGLLPMDDSIHAGPLIVRVHVKLGGRDVTEEQLHELVAWSEKHSPVGDTIGRAVPLEVSVETVS